MNPNTIRSAFRARLMALAGLPPVAWQNRAFVPPNQGVWLKEAHLPATSALTSFGGVGLDGLIEKTGIYQITVFSPVNSDTKTAEQWAGTLEQHFKPGVVVSYEGQFVRCEQAVVAAPVQDTTGFGIPVSIRYRLHHANA